MQVTICHFLNSCNFLVINNSTSGKSLTIFFFLEKKSFAVKSFLKNKYIINQLSHKASATKLTLHSPGLYSVFCT